jgi:phosphoribosylformylglycinamidine (FGAM) synthase-like enzyme
VHLQDGEPQPPVLHRALSGRGDRRRRHPARRLHHGRAPDRQPERAALRRADHPKTRHLVAGVVAGIGGYGNCFRRADGRRAVNFHPATTATSSSTPWRSASPTPTRFLLARREGRRQPVVYVGSKTGRDGIHGATMASAEFDETREEKRPTVQVGDPFTEKLLLEACLELMAKDAIIAIQDMGAAGLTCSAVEMARQGRSRHRARPRQGAPQREEGMTAYEMMLSESQERMLMVLKPGRRPRPRRSSQMGARLRRHRHTTDTVALRHQAQRRGKADLPIKELGDEAPLYDRPSRSRPKPRARRDIPPAGESSRACPEAPRRRPTLLASAGSGSSTTPHRRQHRAAPGGDAAVVRVRRPQGARAHHRRTPRYCEADPFEGGKQAVAEAWRNLTASARRRSPSPTI